MKFECGRFFRRLMAGVLVLAVISAATMLSAAVASGGAAANPVSIYVANAGSNSVTSIALATNTPGSPIPVGSGPFGIAITTPTQQPIGTGTPPPTPPPTPTPTPCLTPPPTPPTHTPGALATKTTLKVFPNPAFQGLPIIFLTNVAPFGATGTVQFMDGPTALGAPVPVASGFALTITTLPKGTHSLSAAFTPTDPAAFAPSASAQVSLTVHSLFGRLGLWVTPPHGRR